MSAGNPNVVDPASRREVISFGKNANNHNGGTIAFGPDGYMYLGLGDGGNAKDVGSSHIEPGGNAQNLSTPLGKMLRFDPVNPSLTITALAEHAMSAVPPRASREALPGRRTGLVCVVFGLSTTVRRRCVPCTSSTQEK